MEQHPTPYPGKHRRIGAVVGKGKIEVKGSREANIVPARYREKRVFGSIRSTNIAVEKPQLKQKPSPANVCKTTKLPLVSAKPAVKNDTTKLDLLKVTSDPNMVSSNKAKAEKLESLEAMGVAAKCPSNIAKTDRKKSVVSFQEPFPSKKSSRKSFGDDVQCTPLSSVKSTVLVGTPYYSAQNCSKCHLDKLESASYWLSQIKLAESVGKHFVSASFFRLAFECHAEPCRRLKNELKGYMERHVPGADFWTNVSELYGLSSERHPADSTVHDGVSSVQKTDVHSALDMENEVSYENRKILAEFDAIGTKSLSVSRRKSLNETDTPHRVGHTPETKESSANEAEEGKSIHNDNVPTPKEHTGSVAIMDVSTYEANKEGSQQNALKRLPSNDMHCQNVYACSACATKFSTDAPDCEESKLGSEEKVNESGFPYDDKPFEANKMKSLE